jgi:acetyl/propionyl-CoA carboxylase alpha subunit/acetyl-CoA carboxylase carboxyltransferase component
MHRLLIANRGEVALRIARAAHDLALTPIGLFATDDAHSPALARMAQRIALPGAGPAAYLDIPAIIAAAVTAGADALHPGWGFLSESPALAQACADATLTFIGPSAALLSLLGDKRRAREAAAAAGLPVPDAAATEADAAGLLRAGPILLKPAEGGGGRGMRIVTDPAALAAAWQEAAAEARSAIGAATLFAERLITEARHIEVQIAADGASAVSLGTRDCTLQRRHQKLIETAPAAGIPALASAAVASALERDAVASALERGAVASALERDAVASALERDAVASALERDAIAMATALGYRGLGTWEFLVTTTGFWFMEVNPRLQVEHTVTEAVTGLDLVAIQLRLAQGASLAELGLTTPPRPRGYAMQLRINAETLTPSGAIIPDSGQITRLVLPAGPGIRVDHAIAEGLTISPAYDSLLAKLIVHGPDRATVLRRAAAALNEFIIEGVRTLIPTLQRLLALGDLQADRIDTRFLEREAAGLVPAADAVTGHPHAITAPMAGRLVALDMAAGDIVRAGQRIALVEAMKMQMEVIAPQACLILALSAALGDTIPANHALATIAPVTDMGLADSATPPDDSPRHDLAALQARLLATRDEGRPDATARRHAAGSRTTRENLADLFDPGSFSEYGALALAAQRRRRSMEELIRISPADGLVAGIGTIAGTPTAALAYDYTVLAGTQGFLNHKKTDRLLGIVHRDHLPLVLFAEGGGGRPGDTDVMGVAGLDLSTFASFARCSGAAPLVGIAHGHCFAGNAALLGCCDTIIATTASSIGMGGPAMIEGGGLGRFRPEQVGPSAVQAANGVIDLLVADETEAVAQARRYLGYFAAATPAFTSADQDALRRVVPENRHLLYDMRGLIDTLADTGSVLELRHGFAAGMITALIRIEGRAMGLIANNPAHLGGAIDAPAADKAARFLQLCDSHGLPVLSLCDTPGFMVGPETERTAQVRHVCRLFVTGAALGVPVFCLVPRRGYGLGAMAMAAGGFHQTRLTAAWPSGEFGGMGLEGAVRLGYRRELAAETDPAAREALFRAHLTRLQDEGQAMNMAAYVEIDTVIDPAESRTWIARGLRTARTAPSRRSIDTW